MGVSALDVADFFIEQGVTAGNPLTQMKLQNLLFCAQGAYMALNKGQRLFPEGFEKWEVGPICRPVYDCFKFVQDKPLTNKANPSVSITDPDIQSFLKWVWQAYGLQASTQLTGILTSNTNWHMLPMFEKIPDETMRDSFVRQLAQM